MKQKNNFLPQFIIWSVLLIIIFYTGVLLFGSSYHGFTVTNDGVVKNIFLDNHLFAVGDKILSIDGVEFNDFYKNPYSEIFANKKEGEKVLFVYEQDGEIKKSIMVVYEPFAKEFWSRVPNSYLIGLIFWSISTFIFLNVRPKNQEWYVLIISSLLTAIWLSTGTLGIHKLYFSGIIFRVSFWLAVPTYLHLQWIYSKPIRDIPKRLLFTYYCIFVTAAILQSLTILDSDAYSYGLLLALLGSIIILIVKFIVQKNIRKDIIFLLFAWGIMIIPQIIMSAIPTEEYFPKIVVSILLFPLVPLTYLNASFKRSIGAVRFRNNPLMATYLYFAVMITLISITFILIMAIFSLSSWLILTLLIICLVFAVLSTFLYQPFCKWINLNFLGMIYPIKNVVSSYSIQISKQESVLELKKLIQDNLTKDLLIKKSWILLESDYFSKKFTRNLSINELLPKKDELKHFSRTKPTETPFKDIVDYDWIRLLIPIQASGTCLGWWFIGEHDPDDIFSVELIDTLQIISIQIGMKITSILKTEQIRTLYKIRVTREETEESYILRELHDTVLNEFALFKEAIEKNGWGNKAVSSQYEKITKSIRNTIAGLRPPMSNYSLYKTIEDFCFQARKNSPIIINNNIKCNEDEDAFYNNSVKLNIYRILQQGINNALKHANANEITLYGSMEKENILIEICDDGDGIEFDFPIDSIDTETINYLLQKKHFGIAGMMERAKLINATLKIETEINQGTTIVLEWFENGVSNVKVQNENL